MRRIAAAPLLIAALFALADAQARLAFEVASIKRNPGIDQFVDLGLQPGGGLKTTNMPLMPLIWIAYGVQAYQIVDAPDWVRTERFDINAKPPDGVVHSRDAQFAMIRSLLEDRFRLRVRPDRRQMPVYNLVTARSDARLGSGLTRAAVDCAAEKGAPTAPADPVAAGCTLSTSPGRITSRGYALRVFATALGPSVDRVIVDRTGLTGTWNIDLKYAPDRVAPDASPSSPDTPSLFTAIQEQLGLRLEPGTGLADVLVIEQVSRPTAD